MAIQDAPRRPDRTPEPPPRPQTGPPARVESRPPPGKDAPPRPLFRDYAAI